MSERTSEQATQPAGECLVCLYVCVCVCVYLFLSLSLSLSISLHDLQTRLFVIDAAAR